MRWPWAKCPRCGWFYGQSKLAQVDDDPRRFCRDCRSRIRYIDASLAAISGRLDAITEKAICTIRGES